MEATETHGRGSREITCWWRTYRRRSSRDRERGTSSGSSHPWKLIPLLLLCSSKTFSHPPSLLPQVYFRILKAPEWQWRRWRKKTKGNEKDPTRGKNIFCCFSKNLLQVTSKLGGQSPFYTGPPSDGKGKTARASATWRVAVPHIYCPRVTSGEDFEQ